MIPELLFEGEPIKAKTLYEQPLLAGRQKLAATGHQSDGKPIAGRWHTYPEIAAAGLWTTPSDLARFAIEVQNSGDTIALLDVSNPAETKIIEVLWQRGEELNVAPCWPVYWPETRRCYFSAVDDDKRPLYSLELRESRRPKPVDANGPDEQPGGLRSFPYGPFSFSPDGRYLLFQTNRP